MLKKGYIWVDLSRIRHEIILLSTLEARIEVLSTHRDAA